MLLLPCGARVVGLVLTALGVVAAVLRFRYDVKPAALDVSTFAVYSSFFESKWWSRVSNNLSEELAAAPLLIGLGLTAFSREHDECVPIVFARIRALWFAVATNTLLLSVSVLVVFGMGFVNVLVANMFSTLLLYLVAFRYLLSRWRRRSARGRGSDLQRSLNGC